MNDGIIHLDRLIKHFGRFRALDGLELHVAPGEVHGFLGPNGSGKSTTIRILLGLMRADAGSVAVFGEDPWRHGAQLHRRIAYVPGDVSLWSGLTGGQCIDVLTTAQGGVPQNRVRTLVERFDLDPTKRVRDYSKGNRQKVALVAALAATVELLVLDEPTSGLDPLMEQIFQDTVRERRQEGCAVLLSSHLLAEVEALADRVSIIRRGRTVTTGSLAELRRHTRTTVHCVTDEAPRGLDAACGVEDRAIDARHGRVDSRFTIDAEHLDDAIGRLHAARIHTLTVTPPSLDALFLRNYGDEPVSERAGVR